MWASTLFYYQSVQIIMKFKDLILQFSCCIKEKKNLSLLIHEFKLIAFITSAIVNT